MKFRYIDNIYTDIENDKKFLKKLKTLGKKKPDISLYLITYPITGHGLLEIYPEAELLQPYYRSLKKYLNIVGVMSSRQAAKDIIPEILNDIMNEMGKLDVHGFIKSHMSNVNNIDEE